MNQNMESANAHAKVCAALESWNSLGNSTIPRFSGSILESWNSLYLYTKFQDCKIPRFSGSILESWNSLGNSKIWRLTLKILEFWNSSKIPRFQDWPQTGIFFSFKTCKIAEETSYLRMAGCLKTKLLFLYKKSIIKRKLLLEKEVSFSKELLTKEKVLYKIRQH